MSVIRNKTCTNCDMNVYECDWCNTSLYDSDVGNDKVMCYHMGNMHFCNPKCAADYLRSEEILLYVNIVEEGGSG